MSEIQLCSPLSALFDVSNAKAIFLDLQKSRITNRVILFGSVLPFSQRLTVAALRPHSLSDRRAKQQDSGKSRRPAASVLLKTGNHGLCPWNKKLFLASIIPFRSNMYTTCTEVLLPSVSYFRMIYIFAQPCIIKSTWCRKTYDKGARPLVP